MTKTKSLADLKAEMAQIRLAMKSADTDWFLKKDNETPQGYGGLSETKRYFTDNYPGFLKSLNKGKKMTSTQFHELLATKLGL